MKKIIILTTIILFVFLIVGSVSATDKNTTSTLKTPTTTNTGHSVKIDSYENPKTATTTGAITTATPQYVVWQDYREGEDKPVIYWKDLNNPNSGRVSGYYGPQPQSRGCGD